MGLFGFTTSVEDPSFAVEDVVTGISLVANHILVLVDARSAVTITLPAASDNEGTVYIFKKIDSSGNSVTIDGYENETIDGEQTVVLNLQFAYVTVACDGDEWFIIGGQDVKMEEILRSQETLLERLAKQLKAILRCLSSMSGLNIDEED